MSGTSVNLRRARITTDHLNLRFTMEDMRKIKLAAKQGWPLHQIATLMRVGPVEMNDVLARNGIHLRNQR